MFGLSLIIILCLYYIFIYFVHYISFPLCSVIFAPFSRVLLFIRKICIFLLVVIFMLIICMVPFFLFSFIRYLLFVLTALSDILNSRLVCENQWAYPISPLIFCWLISTRSEHITFIYCSTSLSPTFALILDLQLNIFNSHNCSYCWSFLCHLFVR